MVAVSTALQVLGFLELPEDQVPPEKYWHSSDHLKDWFASVRQKSKDRARGMESIPTDEGSESDYVDPDVAALRN